MKVYFVYMMTNHSRTLYIGVTNNLQRRVSEHKKGKADGFTKRYKINQLVYHEQVGNIISAINREKQLKKWRREKKINLIEKFNPLWLDLSEEF
jgi:putative endonuclease